MRRILKNTLIISVLLVFANFLFLSKADAIINSGNNQPEKKSIKSTQLRKHRKQKKKECPSYAPGEIIIKFKEEVYIEEKTGEITASGQRGGHITNRPNTDSLNKKYKVKKMKRVFGESKEEMSSGILSLSDIHDQQIERKEIALKREKSIKKRFSQRAKRVPKGAKVPYLGNCFKLEFTDKNLDILAVAAEYAKDPNVEYAEPNYIREIQMIPDDTYYSSYGSWGQTHDDLWGLKIIQTEQAWDIAIAQGGGIVVAVVDTGIDYNHEDIFTNMWVNTGEVPSNGIDDDGNGYVDDIYGYDFSYEDNDPIDGNGHGTHCAGTIAAIGNNSRGIIGVAPNAEVMAVKGLSDSGSGYSSQLAGSLIYAADNGADVISNSWGGWGSSQLIEDAVNYAHSQGCVVVAAAGNSNADISEYRPAGLTNVITVASSDHNDEQSYFSNWGVKIDVAAPGSGISGAPPSYEPARNILSLRAEGTGDTGLVVGEKYYRQAGTSMACPHVSGFAALLLSGNPTFTNEEVRQAIRVSADDLGDAGWDLNYGFGRINTYKALLIDSVNTAKIYSPSSYAEINGMIDIRGTASGNDFSNYVLEYAQGNNPQTWTTLAMAYTPVVNDVLISDWDTTAIIDGNYTLRLTVTDITGNIFEDRILVTIQNTYLSSPNDTDFISTQNNILEIMGTAAATDLQYYNIEYFRVNDSGNPLESPRNNGITLSNGGNSSVIDGSLATFDTSVITTAGIYTLRLTKVASATMTHEINIYLDPLLKNGWPRQIPPYPVNGFLLGFSTHTVADINNDGKEEIIVGYGKKVYVFTDDGEFLPGWPQDIDYMVQDSPAVGDLDGDGFMEVVSGKGRYVWHHDGTLVNGWPNISLSGEPIIEDINGDGRQDLVLVSAGGTIHVLDINGNPLPGWPVSLGDYWYINHNGAVGDVDMDGEKEIVVIAYGPGVSPHIHIVNPDGTYEAVGPVFDYHGLALVLGDLDGDHDLEIVVVNKWGSIQGKKVYAVHHDGTEVTGWPVIPTNPLGNPLGNLNSPTLGDIDGDGTPEVVVGTGDSYGNSIIYAWRHDGTLLDGSWPRLFGRRPIWINAWGSFYGYGSAAIGDIDDDGNTELFASSNSPYVNILSSVGGDLSPYELRSSSYGSQEANTPALADIDGDGKFEVVWIDFNFKVFVWDLPDNYDLAKIEWGQFLHDVRHTGRYASPLVCGNGVCEDGESCSSCPEDCGVCLTFCTDSDGGQNYSLKGTTTNDLISRVDSCYDPAIGLVDSCVDDNCALKEFYCSIDYEVYADINYDACPNGCQNAICIECGNGVCEEGEDCLDCSDDCIGGSGGTCSACWKGQCDGICNAKKETSACADCAESYCCGDGICGGAEDAYNCQTDCGCTSNADCNDGESCTADVCNAGICENTWPACGISDGCCADQCSVATDPDCQELDCGACFKGICDGLCHPVKENSLCPDCM